MTKVIVACCVLHNICLENNDNGDDFSDENFIQENDLPNHNEENEIVDEYPQDRRMLLFQEMYGV